jgi:large exoprotein involved in heme utilization and adhesion
VNIAQLRIDPSQGLTNLPTQPVDASNQITHACAAGSGKLGRNELIATGRGGLPPNPTEALDVDTVWSDFRILSTRSVSQGFESAAARTLTSQPANPTPQSSILEAQGWAINDKGQVVLTATAPTVTPHSSWQTQSDCRRS